jgi:glycosyltransferase involved in cell wall biosynthesis
MTENNLYIPFKERSDASIGGPSTFMKNLKTWLDKHHYPYSEDIENSAGIFFPIAYDIETLKRFKKQRKHIIQRLDGIFYPEKHGKDYKKMNKTIKQVYQNLATHTVFQSEYCKNQCFKMFGKKKEGQYSIIHNGVNQSIFYPSEEKKTLNKDDIRLVMTGNFRNPDQLYPVIKALELVKNRLTFTLTIAGPISDASLKEYLKQNYIQYAGELDIKDVAGLLRQSDIFLFSSLNPPCPNSVLEAVSCGLPVVAFSDGSMPELLNFNSELLAAVPDRVFNSPEDLIPDKLAEKILLAVEEFEKFRQKTINYYKMVSFDLCGKKYVDTFETITLKYQSKANSLSLKKTLWRN